MLSNVQTAFLGEQAVSCYKIFEWFPQFKGGRTPVDDDPDRSVSSLTSKMNERARHVVHEDRHGAH